MKKLFMFALVFAFVGFANAQQKTEKRGNNFEEWSTEIGLTATQKAEIQKIEANYGEKRVAIRQTGTAKDFKALNDEKKAEIYKLLTPEQIKKDEQFKQKKIAEKEAKAALKSGQK